MTIEFSNDLLGGGHLELLFSLMTVFLLLTFLGSFAHEKVTKNNNLSRLEKDRAERLRLKSFVGLALVAVIYFLTQFANGTFAQEMDIIAQSWRPW